MLMLSTITFRQFL